MDIRDMAPTCAEAEFVRFLNEGGDIEETEVDHAAALLIWRNLAVKGLLNLVRLRPDPLKASGPFTVVSYDPRNEEHRVSLRAEITKCNRSIKRNTRIKRNVLRTLAA